MITPEEALQLVRDYVAEEQPWSVVVGLLDDDEDYLARQELRPGWQWPLGPGPVFVAKTTGAVWSAAYGEVLDKIESMRPVT